MKGRKAAGGQMEPQRFTWRTVRLAAPPLSVVLALALGWPATAAWARGHHPKPVPPPAAPEAALADSPAADPSATDQPADDPAAAPDATEPGTGAPAGEQPAELPEPEGVHRSTPADAAAEMAWVNKKIAEDPFLQPFKAIGRAPDVKEFYNPLERLKPGLPAQFASYMVQDAQGHVVGNLAVTIERQASPLFGPVDHCILQPSFSDRRQVEVWESAVSAKPLRVLRRATTTEPGPVPDASSPPTPGSPPTAASGSLPGSTAPTVLSTETLDATYFFDRIVVTKDGGPVTLSARKRLLPYSFDVAQLPLLVQQLDFEHADWPFEATLFDPSVLQPLQLQLNRPDRKTVETAEPASCDCWALPVRLGNTQLTWYVERATHRLVKFQLGSLTYTLQQYSQRGQS
jgi:hypothetical protein